MEWTAIAGEALKATLDEFVSPRLSRYRTMWRGDNPWVEEGERPVRRMVRFLPLKGARGLLSWGYSLGLVPLISGNCLRYHRTFKSARVDVFEWPGILCAFIFCRNTLREHQPTRS